MFSLVLNFLPAASESAVSWVNFYSFLLKVGYVAFIGVVGTGAVFFFKYRRRTDNDVTPYIPHSFSIEFASIFVTSVVVAIIFLWGWFDYAKYYTPQHPYEYEINVIGRQWNWQVQYAHGVTLTNEMFVPRGKPVKLIMTSKDVIHSFFLPAFRVKQDTVPGQFTTLRFTATLTGTYDIFCAEYCGASHSGMIGKIHVLEPEDFEKWKSGTYKLPSLVAEAQANEGKPVLSMAEQGKILYQTKTCNTCHTVNGSPLIGPSFKGLFGSKAELMDGSFVDVDENYVRESIIFPMKKIVKGYPPAMPTFQGMLSDEEINQIMAYMKTLK